MFGFVSLGFSGRVCAQSVSNSFLLAQAPASIKALFGVNLGFVGRVCAQSACVEELFWARAGPDF